MQQSRCSSPSRTNDRRDTEQCKGSESPVADILHDFPRFGIVIKSKNRFEKKKHCGGRNGSLTAARIVNMKTKTSVLTHRGSNARCESGHGTKRNRVSIAPDNERLNRCLRRLCPPLREERTHRQWLHLEVLFGFDRVNINVCRETSPPPRHGR